MKKTAILKEFYNKNFVMDEDTEIHYIKWRSVVLEEGFKPFCLIINGARVYFDGADGFVDRRVINITDLSLKIYNGGVTVTYPLKFIESFEILYEGEDGF